LLGGAPFCDLTFTFTDRESLPPVGQEVFAENFAINPGGSFNISSALSRLGLRVGLKAQIGSDIFSRFCVEQMERCGLALDLITRIDRPKPIVTVGISFPHDRLFISYAPPEGDVPSSPRIAVEDLETHRPRVLFTYGGEGVDIVREARRRGIVVVLDTNWNPEYLRSEYLRTVLAEVDVAVPNLPEALQISAAADAQGALDCLSDICRCAVVKMGPEGCIAACEGKRYAVPAIPVRAVETTGAGDNFNAGLIYGLLRGYPFSTALRCANIAGGLSTLVAGGCQGDFSAEVVERVLGEYGAEVVRERT
jgi:sugar/nucleoside kinase (ribokinase family)